MPVPLEGQIQPLSPKTETEQKIEAVPTRESQKKKNSFFSALKNLISGVTIKEKIFFVQQLGIMVQTGISLAVALRTLSDQTRNKKFKIILEDLKMTVERGSLLSDGLENHHNVFGDLFINMIKAGESSGRLEEVLKQIFIQMKKDYGIMSKVKSAMIYPSIIITAMGGVGIMVMVYVIPNLISIFEEMEAKLPLATRVLIALSTFTLRYGILLAAGLIGLAIAFYFAIHNPRGKFIFHKALLNTPIAGPILQKINLARFCRTLSSLLKTDIAIIKSFEITSNVLGNELFKKALLEAKEKIKKGSSIYDSLEPYKNLFPPIITQMILVGEETGSLDNILEQSAVFYEDDIDQIMKNLPSIIEPVLILVLGLGVAAMAIAIIMPMYSLSEQF